MGDGEMKESDVVEQYLDLQRDRGLAIRQIVSHAVRWYTGEACPDDDDDDEDDEEELDDEDSDEDDDEDDEEKPESKPKVATKKEAKNATEKPFSEIKEECKQQ